MMKAAGGAVSWMCAGRPLLMGKRLPLPRARLKPYWLRVAAAMTSNAHRYPVVRKHAVRPHPPRR